MLISLGHKFLADQRFSSLYKFQQISFLYKLAMNYTSYHCYFPAYIIFCFMCFLKNVIKHLKCIFSLKEMNILFYNKISITSHILYIL